MGEPAIVFDRVWKKFRRGERHDSLRDLFPSLLARFSSAKEDGLNASREFWALRDLSFAVGPGEALGIIGANGAGKSTTLKLLTRILRPTKGVSHVRGRVGALIEVAAGFHPDLTGRENVFLQGAIMGMRRADIAKRFDDIIEFAGVEAFVDTPVKRYSSGMNARLGFAIAANLEPDVLIIDEVLSVGDMAFQKRCIERMAEFKRNGVSIAFVSHNLQAVAELCDAAILLRNSQIASQGAADDVIQAYVTDSSTSTQAGTADVALTAELIGAGAKGAPVRPGDRMLLRVTALPRVTFSDVTIGFLLHRATDNLVVYDGNFTDRELGTSIEAGRGMTLDFDFTAHLTRGQYYVSVHLYHNPTSQFVGYLSPAASFGVRETRTHAGVADLDVRARTVADLAGVQ